MSYFENFVNSELPYRISINAIPLLGNLDPSGLLVTTGIGLQTKFASLGDSLLYNGTQLDTIQGIATDDTPTFYNLNLTNVSDGVGNFLTISSNEIKYRTTAEVASDIGAAITTDLSGYLLSQMISKDTEVYNSGRAYSDAQDLILSGFFNSNFLPLSGGTLTGGLYGTSGIFDSIKVDHISEKTSGHKIVLNNSGECSGSLRAAGFSAGRDLTTNHVLDLYHATAANMSLDCSNALGARSYFDMYNGTGGLDFQVYSASYGGGTSFGIGVQGNAFIHASTVTDSFVIGTDFGAQLVFGTNNIGRMFISSAGAITCSGTLQATQLISSIASGTAPLSVTSPTLVTNLNADKLDGYDASYFQTASSSITSTGTSGYITKFNSPSGLVNSIISESGTALTISGELITFTNEGSTADTLLNLVGPHDGLSQYGAAVRLNTYSNYLLIRSNGSLDGSSSFGVPWSGAAVILGVNSQSMLIGTAMSRPLVLGTNDTAAITISGTDQSVMCSSTLQATQLISTIALGTAPLTVASSTLVTNLNADKLDGYDASSFQLAGNVLTGTGTSGYIARFDSTSGLVNSIILASGTALTAAGTLQITRLGVGITPDSSACLKLGSVSNAAGSFLTWTGGTGIVSSRTPADVLSDISAASLSHTHSKLVGSDGDPDPSLSIDTSGNATCVGTLQASGLSVGRTLSAGFLLDTYAASGAVKQRIECANVEGAEATWDLYDGSVSLQGRVFSRSYGAGTYFGVNLSGNAFLRAVNVSGGMAIGTHNAMPLVLGTANTAAVTISSAQAVTCASTLQATEVAVGAAPVADVLFYGRGSTYARLRQDTSSLSGQADLLFYNSTWDYANLAMFGTNYVGSFGGVNLSGHACLSTNGKGLLAGTTGAYPMYLVTNNTTAMTISSAQAVTCASTIQATSVTAGIPPIAGVQFAAGASNANCNLGLYCYDDGSSVPAIVLAKSDTDTLGTASQTDSGDVLGALVFQGVNSSSAFCASAAYIAAIQNGVAGATYIPTDLVFYTSTASVDAAEAMRISTTKAITCASTLQATKIGAGVVPANNLDVYGYGPVLACINIENSGSFAQLQVRNDQNHQLNLYADGSANGDSATIETSSMVSLTLQTYDLKPIYISSGDGNRTVTINTNQTVVMASGIGVFGKAAPSQASHIANPTDLATALTAISGVLVVLENIGFVKTS